MNIRTKLLAALLAALCLITFAAQAQQVVANEAVYLRSGPGLGYAQVGAAPKGASMTWLDAVFTDERGVDWYRVSYNKKNGWVSSTYATLGGTSGASVTTTGNTHLRSGPGLDYKEMGTVPKGSTIPYLGVTMADDRPVDWYKVSYDGQVGWVSSKYAKLGSGKASGSGSSGGSSSSGGSASSGSALITTASVNLRSGPGKEYEKIDSMPQGTFLTWLSLAQNDTEGVKWYKVSYKGKSGWVSSKYAAFDDGSWGDIAITGNANLRADPNLYGKALATIPKGSAVPYLGKTSTDERGVAWYNVAYGGMSGWVSSKYASFGGKSSGGSSMSWGGGYAGGDLVATDSVNLRSTPSLNGKILTSIPKGGVMTYLHTTDTDDRGVDWYEVNYNGTDGWVSSRLVKFK